MKRYTNEELLEDVDRIYKKYGDINHNLYTKHGICSIDTLSKRLGGFIKIKNDLYGGWTSPKKGRQEITKNEFIQDCWRVLNQYGKLTRPMYKLYGKYGDYYFHTFGGIKQILKEMGVEWVAYNQKDKVDIAQDVLDLYKKYGFMKKDLYVENGKYSGSAIRTAFGSFNKMFEELGIPINTYFGITKEDIVDDFIKFYTKYNTSSSTLYRKHGKYSQTIIDRAFGSHVNLVESLNLKALNKKHKEKDLLDELHRLHSEFGYISKGLIDRESFVTYEGFAYRFGGKDGISEVLGVDNAFLDNRSENVIRVTSILDDLNCEYTMEKGFPWLINDMTNRHMYIDIFIDSLNLAIEYDGEQHYRYIPYFHKTRQKFDDQQYRDKLKERLIVSHGLQIERIKFDQDITKDLIRNIINKYK